MAKITWFGHAAFKIEIAGKIVLIDPWLDDNPTSPVRASEITRADMVYVTHDHSDHLGDAFDICKRTKLTFVATFELGAYAEENGVENVVGLNIGGSVEIKGVRLSIVQAFHTASRGGADRNCHRGRRQDGLSRWRFRSLRRHAPYRRTTHSMWL